jgi:hypothetical protein
VITRHVSAETMAGFRQGVLSPRKNSRISAHLAGCDRCRTLDEDLAGVRTLLAGAQPPPIPEHLAARIQTALATEAASRVVRPAGNENGIGTVAPGSGRPAGGPDWRPARPGRRPRLPGMPRLGSRVALGSLAAAAAVLVVIGGMYEMFGSRGSGSGSGGTAASAPSHRSAGQSSGNGIALPATGGSASRPVLQYRHAGHQDSVMPVETSMDFTPNRLRSQVAAAVASYSAGVTRTVPSANPLSGVHSSAGAPAHQPARFGNIPASLLQGCVNRIDAGELVLLVEVARYRGTPATVIVTDVTVIGPEQIWVVGTDCSASRSDVLTHATMAAP